MSNIQALFVDVGGVLLTNGWDHHSRKEAANQFHFDYEPFEKRHQATFDAYENGKISLDLYLELSLFNEKRAFTVEQFKEFMFVQSKPFDQMLNLMKEIHKQQVAKIFLLSNEGKELMLHRIERFHLKDFAESCFVSSFVGMRKPDPQFYQLALEISGFHVSEVLYMDDRDVYIQIGKILGFETLLHTDFKKTEETLKRRLHVV